MVLIQLKLTLVLCAIISWGLEDAYITEDNSWFFHDLHTKRVLCSHSECTLTKGSNIILDLKWDFVDRSFIAGPVLTVVDTNNVIFSNKSKYYVCPFDDRPDLIEAPPCNFALVNGTYIFKTGSIIVPGIPEGKDENSGDVSFYVKKGNTQEIISRWPALTVRIK